MSAPSSDSEATVGLLGRVRSGDRPALDALLAEHRAYLRRVVDLQLDARLRARLDPSDVVQDALLEASRRIDDYLDRKPMPFWLWLRRTACERLTALRRRHLGAACRAAEREVPLPAESSALLGRQLLGGPTPSDHLRREELAARVRAAVARLDDDDRAVLLLRHFEGLSNRQAAELLGVEPAAASKRYGRALLRLKAAFDAGSGGSVP